MTTLGNLPLSHPPHAKAKCNLKHVADRQPPVSYRTPLLTVSMDKLRKLRHVPKGKWVCYYASSRLPPTSQSPGRSYPISLRCRKPSVVAVPVQAQLCTHRSGTIFHLFWSADYFSVLFLRIMRCLSPTAILRVDCGPCHRSLSATILDVQQEAISSNTVLPFHWLQAPS